MSIVNKLGQPAKRIVVVGAVAGGASAAARARRLDEHATITLFEKGPDPSFANCGLPYYIGGEITDRAKLSVQTPASLHARLNLDVRVLTEVISIDSQAKTVTTRHLPTGTEETHPYDDLILSPGSKPFIPPIPGIKRPGAFALRNLEDMDVIHSWLSGKDAKTAVVAGGGFIGIEMAEQLHRRGLKVTLVEALPQLLAPLDPEMAMMIQEEMESHGIRVVTGKPIKAFEDNASALCGDVVLGDGVPNIPADMVLLGLGVRADTALAKSAGIELNARGGIVVDSQLRTSVPNIWAVGDAIEVKNPIVGGQWMVALAGPANRQGRMVADNIFGKNREFKGTFGTSVVRVFNLTAAGTGLNERGLQMANLKYQAVHLFPNSHAGYYPGASQIALKLLFEVGGENEGRVLGAQAVGNDGADKRIDVIATAMQAGLKVDDLAQLELCYAPPVGSAKDPVNYAGMIAQDILDGLVQTVQYTQIPSLAKDPKYQLLDVRSPKEIETKGGLPAGTMNIPVDELRSRINELPKDKIIVTSCFVGQRGYYAARILMQNGFEVRNLDGAFSTYLKSGLKKSVDAA
uniref:Rhodanese domain-containing protein n=1 Tax=Chrysotila carterae TaxID=13221 RepID=A0A7S4AZR6_CHRCT|mmetsp:Transcript_34/g.72  ORF Transcript_34/g.72 Transcript_34/m.72 type:complete len:575 (-) Transcript_34:376-2100(-)